MFLIKNRRYSELSTAHFNNRNGAKLGKGAIIITPLNNDAIKIKDFSKNIVGNTVDKVKYGTVVRYAYENDYKTLVENKDAKLYLRIRQQCRDLNACKRIQETFLAEVEYESRVTRRPLMAQITGAVLVYV